MKRPLLLLLALAACSRDPAATIVQVSDDRIGDPALAAAIAAPIMTDPGLSQSANADAIRPPTAPDPLAMPSDTLGAPVNPGTLAGLRRAPTPTECPSCRIARGALTLGALAERQPRPGAAACAATIRYAGGWVERLPPALSLPPGTRVVEEAGSDAPGCALRLASLDSRVAPAQLVDWYFTRAVTAGYAITHQADTAMHVLTGRRGAASFAVHVTARKDGGSHVALVDWGG